MSQRQATKEQQQIIEATEGNIRVRAVTPGQAVVLYDGEYVAGGGTIL